MHSGNSASEVHTQIRCKMRHLTFTKFEVQKKESFGDPLCRIRFVVFFTNVMFQFLA